MIMYVLHTGVKAVSAAVALLEASAGHDAMHSMALRLVLSPAILPQIAQPPAEEVPELVSSLIALQCHAAPAANLMPYRECYSIVARSIVSVRLTGMWQGARKCKPLICDSGFRLLRCLQDDEDEAEASGAQEDSHDLLVAGGVHPLLAARAP